MADFVAEVVKTFENLGESKLLTSSATQLKCSGGWKPPLLSGGFQPPYFDC